MGRPMKIQNLVKTAPSAVLLKKAVGVAKASGEPNKVKIGKVTREQIRQIAEAKSADLTAANIDQAMRTVEGTARSMGLEVVD